MVAVSSPSNKSVMGRESRHVYVSGLPETVTDEKINGFFSIYGRVHQIERSADGVVVSFMDVRSAQKAHAGDHRLEPGIPFRISFHEPGTKNSLMTSSSISTGGSNGTVSPKSIEMPRRRSPSPRGSKDSNRSSQLRVSSSVALKRIIRSDPYRREQGRSPEHSTSTAVACSSGLQGVYVERLPPRSDGTIKESIRDALKKHGRIVDISIEGDGDARKALVIFQRVVDMEKLVNDSHVSIHGVRVRIRAASHVVVQEAYNDYLSLNSPAGSGTVVTTDLDLPSKYAQPNGARADVDVFHPKASRTLYVGGLETRISDDTLRRRFVKYGTILDVDVKNYESPSPFAFIQFADIDSAVRAINAHAAISTPQTNKKGKKFQPNFGRSMTTNKLWIGSVPQTVSEDYVTQKLKTLSDGVIDVVVDMRLRQAIVVFSSTEAAQAALNRIKAGVPKQFVFKVESGEARVPADFCSDRLHDHFIDRKHGGNPVLSTNDESHACLLAPPPDPPSDMPSYRYDYHRDSRRSPSHSRRRERSRSRDRSRERSRHRKPSKYDYEKSSSRRKERKDRKTSASSDSSSSSSGGSTPTRLRSGSNDSRVSSPLSYSQRKERRRDERRDRDRNSNGKFRCSQPGRRSPFGTPKWSGRRSSRHSPVLDERVSHPLAEDRTAPIPDDRKSGDSGFYEDARPPLDPPPAPPPMESLPSVPSPPPADPPPMTHSRLELTRVSQCHTPQTSSGPVFVSPPSTSKQDAIIHLESPVAPIQSLRHSSISIPGTSSATTQKRSSVDGLQTRQNSQNCRSRIFKWPWGNGDVARTPVLFPEICNTRLLDPRSKSDLSCRPPILKLSPPPFALLDSTERPRPVDEWRKRSSSSTVSVDGNRRSCGGTPQRQHSSTTGIEEQRSSIRSQSSGRPIVSRSSSSGAESDPQLSPEAPLPPAPPSALDLLCEPDATPSLTDSWSGVRYRLADIGSKLTDVKSSLLEAHKSVDEIQEREPRQTSATQRTDSFEEKLRSISQKKKSSFDEFTLNITRERIQAIKASVPDGSASLSGLSSCGFTRNVTTPRPALSITIPQPSSASQSTASTPASVKIESPSSVRKPSVSLASRPPPSSPAISSSIVRISAPPTAPVIAYPPNFSVPPPTFAPMLQTPVESQASPLLSAPPPPPQLPPATTVRRDSMSSLKSPPMTPGSCSSWKPSTPSTSSAPTSRCVVQLKEALSVLTTPKTPLSSKLPSKIEKLPARHDSVSALKSPVQTQHQTSLSGRSLSVSDTRKPVLNVPHKDPSTELLAGLFHNKPPTTDFRKLPKIEKKQCTVSNNNEKDKKSENKKDKEHRLRRKEDGTFETKEERSKRKETDRIKKEKTKLKDYKKERKEDRKKSKEEDKEKKDKKTKKNEKEKERERKVKKKKKSRHSSSDEDSSSDDDDHFQRAFNKQIASVNDEGGALGGYSMYDRVKRRSSAVNRDEGAKKTALQKLREKTNEKKGQKRKRVQLDWSDEDEDSRKRDSEDAETSDPEAENSKKEESMDSSDNDTEKKKQVWSSNDSEESGDNKKLKKSGKKHTKQKKASKNINMDDVFGANSSDEEKIHKEKKRKKSKKESSDENDVPKKKGRSEKLDFEAIFGSDKPDKHKKKEKSEREEKERKDKKDRDTKKRSPEDDNGKPAKRLKKEPDSDGSFCSEGEPQKIEKIDTDGEFEENTISEDKVMKIEEHSNDMTIINTATTSNETTEEIAIIPLDQSKEERPRLLTKAALKVFVPSQSSVPASTSSQPSIEADSGESDEGYDGAFPGPSHLVPLHVSSSSSCSDNDESDSDSDSRHSHPREVELVDAAAGYASVTSPEPESYRKDGVNRERIKSSESPIREFTVELKNRDHTRILPVTLIEEGGLMFPETTVSMQSNLEEPVVARQETTADDGDAEKDVRDMSDLQETEDAVQSIFDDYEEEQEPQYPSHDFIRADASGAVKTMVIDEAERAASAIEEIDNLMSKDVSDEQLEPSVEEVINDTEGKSEDEKNDSSPSSETVPMPNIGEEEITMPIPAEVVLTPFGEQAVEQSIPSSISVSIPESNVISAATVSDPRSPLPKNSGSLETSTSTPEPISQSSVIQSKVQVASPQPRISPTGTNSYSNSSGLAQLPPASVGGLTQGLPIITQASQIQQQQYYNLLQQQPKLTAEAQLRVADVQSRVSKPQTPAATLSPAPKAATPVCQQQAVLAQAVQMQQMQQILLAGMRQDPIGYYQQISQSCGQQMAAALLSQVMQYPSTSQTQQLIDFQRQQQQQQQYKTHQDSSVAASSPQPQHQLQERERLLIKETQMRALREREQAAVLQQHQQAIYAQMRQAFHLTQQQQQQGASQGSPAISQTSSASSSTAPVMERKSAAVPPQPRASEDRPVIQVVAPQTASSSPAIAPVVQPLPRADPEMTKRFPVVWQGALSMKHWETAVQMHLVTGSTEMLIKCLGDSNVEAKNAVTIKIEQRMRLDNTQVQSVVNKMADMTQFACMICLPCGLSRDEILSNSATFQTAFIDYFTQKGAAGIANIPAKSSTAGCLVHVFPPGDFPSSYLSFYSPQLFESITSRQASYLFVVLTPEERAA